MQFRTLDELITAYTEDLSRGGLYIRTASPAPIGSVVRVELELPGSGEVVSAVARVAFVLTADQAVGHGREAGMGVGFLDVGGTPVASTIATFIDASAPAQDAPEAPAEQRARVIVVDDDAAFRERAATVVRDLGHDVVVAEDGLAALRFAMQKEPALIVSDVQMPRMDGWTLVRMLRARPSLAHVPVVFVTSLAGDEERLQGYRLGVDDYVPKPYNPEELSVRVQRVLERARAYPPGATSAPGERTLRGDLQHVSLQSLLMFMEMEKRTGVLFIAGDRGMATLHLRAGTVVRVDLPEAEDYLEGAERLLAVLEWTDGRFEFGDSDVTDEDTIGLSVSHAVLEQARRSDEFDPV